jgi:PAS domain S-box-containing protein
MDFKPGMLMDNESAGVAAELIPDGLVAADADGRILFLNTRATRILGRSREELVGADIRQAVDLQDSDGTSWWAVTDPWGGLRIRTGHREKLLMLRDSGREVLVTAKYLRPGRNQPVNRVNILMRDALYRRRAEAENAAVISTVAHELRSPLTSVKGFSSTLLRRWDRFTDDQKRLMLETIEADADRVTRLITELLDVSRIDSGRLQIRPLPIDVSAVFHRHVERAVASGLERDRFAIEVSEELPEVWADPDRLDQILSNLIENALRHGEGVVTLAAQRSNGALGGADAKGHQAKGRQAKEHPAVGVDLLVADQGKGIAADHRKLVFSRFWHGSGRGSTGLGLYVVKGLVEAHGGRVLVEESDGGGARFRISLPSEPPDYLA